MNKEKKGEKGRWRKKRIRKWVKKGKEIGEAGVTKGRERG